MRTHESLEVWEHAAAVADDPEQYGLTKKDVQDLNPMVLRDKDKLRRLALDKEWARIHAKGNEVVIEFDYPNVDDAVSTILEFLTGQGYGENTTVEVHALQQRHRFSASLKDLLDPEKMVKLVGVMELSTKLESLLKRLGRLFT